MGSGFLQAIQRHLLIPRRPVRAALFRKFQKFRTTVDIRRYVIGGLQYNMIESHNKSDIQNLVVTVGSRNERRSVMLLDDWTMTDIRVGKYTFA